MTSLVLSGIFVKRKFLWCIKILRKLHAWEEPGSQAMAEKSSQAMRFQHSLIINISLTEENLTLIFGM